MAEYKGFLSCCAMNVQSEPVSPGNLPFLLVAERGAQHPNFAVCRAADRPPWRGQ